MVKALSAARGLAFMPSPPDKRVPAQTAEQGGRVVALVSTVAYLGLEARSVEVQCQIAAGLPRFGIVGLPDKAVGESRERVQAALA